MIHLDRHRGHFHSDTDVVLGGEGKGFPTEALVVETLDLVPILKLLDTTPSQTTPAKHLISAGGQFKIANSALSVNILTLDDSGNLTVTGKATETGVVLTAAAPTQGAAVK